MPFLNLLNMVTDPIEAHEYIMGKNFDLIIIHRDVLVAIPTGDYNKGAFFLRNNKTAWFKALDGRTYPEAVFEAFKIVKDDEN